MKKKKDLAAFSKRLTTHCDEHAKEMVQLVMQIIIDEPSRGDAEEMSRADLEACLAYFLCQDLVEFYNASLRFQFGDIDGAEWLVRFGAARAGRERRTTVSGLSETEGAEMGFRGKPSQSWTQEKRSCSPLREARPERASTYGAPLLGGRASRGG